MVPDAVDEAEHTPLTLGQKHPHKLLESAREELDQLDWD
jgi:hypothetical protein